MTIPHSNDRDHGGVARGETMPMSIHRSTDFSLSGMTLDHEVATTGGATGPGFAAKMLWRFKWTVLTVFLAAAALGVTAVWLLVAPQYIATTIVEIAPVVPRVLYRTEENGQIPFFQQYLSSQLATITSPVVFDRVLDRPEIRKTKWFNYQPSSFLEKLRDGGTPRERFASAVTVSSPKNSQIVNVSFAASDPKEAKELANSLTEEYLRYTRERVSGEDQAVYQELQREREKRSADIAILEQSVAELRKTLGTSSPDELVAQRRLRLDTLDNQLQTLILESEVMSQHLMDMEKQIAQSPPDHPKPMVQSFYARDGLWNRLQSELEAARLKLDFAKQDHGPRHPAVVQWQKTTESLEKQIKSRESQLDLMSESGVPLLATEQDQNGTLHNAPASPTSLRNQIRQLNVRKEYVQQLVQGQTAEFDRMFELAETIKKKSEDLRIQRERYQSIRQRLEEKELEGRVPATIRALAWAVEPPAANQEKRIKLSFAALLAAMLGGVGAGFVRFSFTPSFRVVEELRPIRGIVLGQIPLQRRRRDLRENSRAISEQVRNIRTALLNQLTSPASSVIQITSTGPGSGKSTTAVLLARSLAQCGRRVLLVDADLHHPTLARKFGVSESVGLLTLLTNKEAGMHVIRQTEVPGLSILPAGAHYAGDHREALATANLTDLFDNLRKEFEIIIVDSGPLLVAADASILAQHADGTIMVIREGHCHRADVLEALLRIETCGGKLFGTVFLGSMNGSSYRYYQSRDETAVPRGVSFAG